MKCPQCQGDHKKKYGMQCACGYDFVFNPTEDNTLVGSKFLATSKPLTDGKFLATIGQASRNGTYHFTDNQLYTAHCRRNKLPSPRLCLFILIGLMLAAVPAGLFFPFALIVLGVGCFGALVTLLISIFSGPPSRDDWDRAVAKWTRVRGPIEYLIREPSLHQPPPGYAEPDIYDYGVERVILVEHDILVDLLVLNGIHAQERALVFAISGYPQYLQPLAKKLLDESPELPVYLLHDSTQQGMAMHLRVSKLVGNHPVIDLGLFPEDVKRMRAVRPLKPSKQDCQIPLDAVPMYSLSAITASALVTGVSFASVLEAQQAESGSDWGGNFG